MICGHPTEAERWKLMDNPYASPRLSAVEFAPVNGTPYMGTSRFGPVWNLDDSYDDPAVQILTVYGQNIPPQWGRIDIALGIVVPDNDYPGGPGGVSVWNIERVPFDRHGRVGDALPVGEVVTEFLHAGSLTWVTAVTDAEPCSTQAIRVTHLRRDPRDTCLPFPTVYGLDITAASRCPARRSTVAVGAPLGPRRTRWS